MSLNNDSMARNRLRTPNNDSHLLNLPPPPSMSPYAAPSLRPSVIPGNFNIPPPPSTPSMSSAGMLNETMSTFNKERLHDVLQHGLGTYVYIENFGLVPKLNHF